MGRAMDKMQYTFEIKATATIEAENEIDARNKIASSSYVDSDVPYGNMGVYIDCVTEAHEAKLVEIYQGEPEICEICGFKSKRILFGPFEVKAYNVSITVTDAKMYKCENCGETLLTDEQLRDITSTIRQLVDKQQK